MDAHLHLLEHSAAPETGKETRAGADAGSRVPRIHEAAMMKGLNSTAKQRPGTGLLLPSREVLLWRESDLAFVIDAARRAENSGYDSVWVGDSLLARPRGEPLTLLAAVAGGTKPVALGKAGLLPLLPPPRSMAHAVATLDRLAEGRVILGIGPGAELPGTHAELKALGVPSDRRVGDMLTAVERCRRLWRNEEPGVELNPRPIRPAGPPIWLGGGGPRMLRLAGAIFDGWLPLSPTPADYESGLRAVRGAGEGAGVGPGRGGTRAHLTVAIADPPDDAAKQLDGYIRAYYGVPAEIMAKTM